MSPKKKYAEWSGGVALRETMIGGGETCGKKVRAEWMVERARPHRRGLSSPSDLMMMENGKNIMQMQMQKHKQVVGRAGQA